MIFKLIRHSREHLNVAKYETENIKCRSEKYLPYVYTEQGISMLSGILKNEIAIKVSINIMRAFVEMRKFVSDNGQVFKRLTKVEYKLLEQDKKFDEIFNELQENRKEEFTQKIFYDGQIYDAYSLIIDNKQLYHIGASLKDLGKKCFAISKIEDMEFTSKIRAFN